MNARQKRFCDEYLIDCNATQAAIRAGYSERTAYSIGEENLRKPELRAYLDSELEKIHTEKVASIQQIMEYLSSVMDGKQKEQVLKFIGEGVQEITDIDVSAKERIKCAELLGKRYGIWNEKVNMTVEAPVVFSGESELEE